MTIPPTQGGDPEITGPTSPARGSVDRAQSDGTRQRTQRSPDQRLERVKELGCLYAFSELLQTPGLSLPAICQGVVDLLPAGWQYPESTCARLTLENQLFTTENFRETT